MNRQLDETIRQLDETIIDGGIRNTHYFNGRLLAADDLRADQIANRQQHWQLGQAIGEGVVCGLEITLIEPGAIGKFPVVEVSQGLALNRLGQMLALPNNEQLTLTPKSETITSASVFSDCDKGTDFSPSLADGFYLLVIKPASGFQESAPVRGLFGAGTVAGCGSRYEVAGVQFRLKNFSLNDLTGISAATQNQLNQLLVKNDVQSQSLIRNILAYLCFSVEGQNAAATDPFKSPSDNDSQKLYGALGALRSANKLGDCEVPLALIYWSSKSISFADTWAVRRMARRIIELDVLSILPGYGYERLLQFQQHLSSLAERLGNVNAVQAQDYFRFVPPVAFFPITGVGSPRGYHPTRFFENFVTGSPSEMGHGKFADILHRSFVYPAVDLQTSPVFQLYQVRENTSAVSAGRSNQLYRVFVSRSLHGPLAEDGVGRTMQDAWDVYRGLIKRRAFLPPGTDEAKVAAQIAITSAIRDVMEMANRQASLAKNWALDKQDALDALKAMYLLQKELATLLVSNIPGIVHTQDREVFGKILLAYLDSGVGAVPALQAAVNARHLINAVHAQDAINQVVGSWSGQGVAVGPFGFEYLESPNGLSLKPGDGPYPHHFNVVNGTDKQITIQLEANVTAPHGKWDSSVKIKNDGGDEISEVTLASGVSGMIIAEVSPPLDAQVNDKAVLTLKATVPPPTDKTSQSTLEMKVASESGPPVKRRVVFQDTVQQPQGFDPENVKADTAHSFIYSLSYSAPNGPATAKFLFTVNLTADDPKEWPLEFGKGTTTSPSSGVFTTEVGLSITGLTQVEVIVRTPKKGGADKVAAITANVKSTDLPEVITAEAPVTINMRVKKG